MATTVVKTIGTGGDYTTLQAWEDACPANLVTADQIWQGQIKNQEFVSASALLTISGTTVDVTRYVELTTEPGASFLDNSSKATNALRYNAANGAGIRFTGGWANIVTGAQSYTRISKIQFSCSGSNGGGVALGEAGGTSGYVVDKCIFESSHNATTLLCQNGVVSNSLIVSHRDAAASIAKLGGTSLYNVTLVGTGTAATDGIVATYGTATYKNVYVGGVTNAKSGSTAVTATNCYTSTTLSGWTTAALSTATFENVTNGTHDFRLKTGSALIDAGVTEATYAATDIIGTVRASGTYDVGAWEFVSGGTNASAGGGTGTGTGSGSGGTATGGSGGSASASGGTGTSTGSGSGGASTAGGAGTFTSDAMENNTGAGPLASVSVLWTWYHGAIGAAPTSTTHGTGSTNSSGVLSLTGLPAGAGFLLVRTMDATGVYYQPGTVT